MGYLDKGMWREGRPDTRTGSGEYVRAQAQFRDRVSGHGATAFPAEPGRYHLYVSLACPWAHRTLIFRKLKRLEDAISVSIVHPLMLEEGWTFDDYPGCIPDTINGFDYLWQIYTKARPGYTGRVSVPVLWDKATGTIVNNESSEIIRMFNSEFDAFTGIRTDFYPPPLRTEIDSVNEFVYVHINNGVYRCGFAATADAYERAFDKLFVAMEWAERRLGESRYLAGNVLTEADWRLFTTLVRFDAVYYAHFKCNLRRISDYPNLSNYLRDLYQIPGVAETVNMRHIKDHYYRSHRHINPGGIVPKGPELNFDAPHDRERFPGNAAADRG